MRDDDLNLVWKALADPTRREILDLLRQRARTTGELSEAFAVSRYAVMKHLTVLEEAALIIVQREGRKRWNYLNAIPIRRIYERWVSEYEAHWAASMLQLKRLAEQPQGATQTMSEEQPSLQNWREMHIEQLVPIDAPPETVFKALTQQIRSWWRAPYFRNPTASGISLNPTLGGHLWEDWGEGEGLLLATVTTIQSPHKLYLSGPFGAQGPATGTIRFDIEEREGGTLLKLTHHAMGALPEDVTSNTSAGWETLLGTNLREFIEDR